MVDSFDSREASVAMRVVKAPPKESTINESTINADLMETASLERLDHQDSLKFLLRLKIEQPDEVVLPKQYYYSVESVPAESEVEEFKKGSYSKQEVNESDSHQRFDYVSVDPILKT